MTDEAEEQDGGTGDGDGADALLRVESDAGQRAGQGRAGQGRAGQGRAGQDHVELRFVDLRLVPKRVPGSGKHIRLHG